MTKRKVTMPKLGESVTEGTINSWLVKEGDYVNKYDPIADVMTDKVNAEIPSSYSGTIKEIVAQEGDTKAVGELICYIETAEEVTNNVKKAEDDLHTNDANKAETNNNSMKTRYSPAVLKLASEHNIDLQTVQGTGMGGRITRKDILQYMDHEQNQPPNKQSMQEQIQTEFISNDIVEIPVTGVRKKIAENMVRSTNEIPHAWMTIEADVTDLVTLRNKMKEEFKAREGYSLTYFAFFVSTIAKALKEYPQLNSTWKNDKIIQHKTVNISIAVAHEDQLFVPVIKHANEKSITGIAKDIHTLANKARTGTLTTDDMQGGTFTVNNTGTFGSISSMGIINYPQAAILQVESIVKRPVIINNMFAARDIVNLSLSLDHRILDGLICGRFLQRVRTLLENINEQSTTI